MEATTVQEISQEQMDKLTRLLEDRRDLKAAQDREKNTIGYKGMNLTQKLIVNRVHEAAMDAISQQIEGIGQ